jgi:biofilm PGA synthesis protein PgaD
MTRHLPPTQSGMQRAAEFTITTLFWLAWLYLIMPLVSLLLWIVGIQLFMEEMIVRGGYHALIEEFVHYGLVILAMLVATLIWVYWNLRRYGRNEKRTIQPAPVSLKEIAATSGLTPAVIRGIRAKRRLRVTFDDNDHPLILTDGIRRK